MFDIILGYIQYDTVSNFTDCMKQHHIKSNLKMICLAFYHGSSISSGFILNDSQVRGLFLLRSFSIAYTMAVMPSA